MRGNSGERRRLALAGRFHTVRSSHPGAGQRRFSHGGQRTAAIRDLITATTRTSRNRQVPRCLLAGQAKSLRHWAAWAKSTQVRADLEYAITYWRKR